MAIVAGWAGVIFRFSRVFISDSLGSVVSREPLVWFYAICLYLWLIPELVLRRLLVAAGGVCLYLSESHVLSLLSVFALKSSALMFAPTMCSASISPFTLAVEGKALGGCLFEACKGKIYHSGVSEQAVKVFSCALWVFSRSSY